MVSVSEKEIMGLLKALTRFIRDENKRAVSAGDLTPMDLLYYRTLISDFEYTEAIRISESDTTAHIINGSTRVITEKDIRDYYNWCNDSVPVKEYWGMIPCGDDGNDVTLAVVCYGWVKGKQNTLIWGSPGDTIIWRWSKDTRCTPSFDGFYQWLKEK